MVTIIASLLLGVAALITSLSSLIAVLRRVRGDMPLAESVPVVFSGAMLTVSPEAVSAAIRSAAAFARLGLSMRDAHHRDRAVDALSLAIVEGLERPLSLADDDQLALPL